MRPAQTEKLHERAVLKMARQLKARADQKRYRPNVAFGEPYEPPPVPSAYTATIGAYGWVFSLSEVAHENDVQHWRCRAALRNGFSAKPTAEDIDVLALFAGEVSGDHPDVLKLLEAQVQGVRAPDGAFYFSWYEGKNAPTKELLKSLLGTMDALFSKASTHIPAEALGHMKATLAHHRDEVSLSPAPEAPMLLDKIDELLRLIEAESARRESGQSEVVTA